MPHIGHNRELYLFVGVFIIVFDSCWEGDNGVLSGITVRTIFQGKELCKYMSLSLYLLCSMNITCAVLPPLLNKEMGSDFSVSPACN